MANRTKDAKQPDPALYLYGVSKGKVSAPKTLRGVDAIHFVEVMPVAGLVCWFSRVDRMEYGDLLTQNMENLEWLATASVHHQRVVGSIAERAEILPARFGTVFLAERSMRVHVEESKKMMAAALDRISGAEEWGVKVFAEAGEAAPQAPAVSGTDYLLKKREILHQRAKPGAPAELPQLEVELKKVSAASMPGGKGKAPQPGLVWQSSFLVKKNRTKQFHEVLRRFAAIMAQARIETTGPWPPYSFANPPEPAIASNERKKVRSAAKPRGSRSRK